MNIEFPDYAYHPTIDEHPNTYYYGKMPGDKYIADMQTYSIRKQYNDGYFERITTYGGDEVLKKLKKIMDRNDISLD